MRLAFAFLEEATSSGSFVTFSFSFPAVLESSLHPSSLETSLESCVVILVVDSEGVGISFKEFFCAIFLLDPIAFVVV